MRPDPQAEGRRWFDQAREDLATAEWDLKGKRYYVVCFHAHQIAEKALKALLYARGELDVIGHSIDRLLGRAVGYDFALDELRARVPLLDTYYIPTRYPNGLPESIPARVYTSEAAESALRLARMTLDAVERAAFARPEQPERPRQPES